MGPKENILHVLGNNSNCVLINPSEIYFSHSRICPYFSGRSSQSLKKTLQEICDEKLNIEDLPLIEILQLDNGEYISLNNRRLWVLKECNKRGLLPYDLEGKRRTTRRKRMINFDSKTEMRENGIHKEKESNANEHDNNENEKEKNEGSGTENKERDLLQSDAMHEEGIFSDLQSLRITTTSSIDKHNKSMGNIIECCCQDQDQGQAPVTRRSTGDKETITLEEKDVFSNQQDHRVLVKRERNSNQEIYKNERQNYKESLREQRKQARKRNCNREEEAEEREGEENNWNENGIKKKNGGKDKNNKHKEKSKKKQNENTLKRKEPNSKKKEQEESRENQEDEGKILVRIGSLSRLSKKQQEKYNKGPWSLNARFDMSLIRSQEKDRKEKQKVEEEQQQPRENEDDDDEEEREERMSPL